RLDQQLVLADLAKHQVAAVIQDGEGRHWCPDEPAPGGGEGPDLEAIILGASQHVGHADGMRADAMADLRRIRGHPLELHHHDKRSQGGIRGWLRTRRHQRLPFSWFLWPDRFAAPPPSRNRCLPACQCVLAIKSDYAGEDRTLPPK